MGMEFVKTRAGNGQRFQRTMKPPWASNGSVRAALTSPRSPEGVAAYSAREVLEGKIHRG